MRDSGGFSLVEVSVAVGVFAFAALAILGMYPVALRMMGSSQRELASSNLATRVVEEYRAEFLSGAVTNSYGLPAPASVLSEASGTNFLDEQGGTVVGGSSAAFRMTWRLQRLPGRDDRIRMNLALAWPGGVTNPKDHFENRYGARQALAEFMNTPAPDARQEARAPGHNRPSPIAGLGGQNRLRVTAGFSVLEILVAAAVLAIVLAVVLQVTRMALGSWTGAEKKFNNFVVARAVMGSLAGELEDMVWGENIPHIGRATTDQALQFFTRREGTGTGSLRPLSFIRYSAANGTLSRAQRAYTWTSREGFSGAAPPTLDPPVVLCEGILAFRYSFPTTNGFSRNLPPNAVPPGSVLITMAVLDPRTYARILELDLLAEIQNRLDELASVNEGQALKAWNDWLATDNNLPDNLRNHIRFFQRQYALPSWGRPHQAGL